MTRSILILALAGLGCATEVDDTSKSSSGMCLERRDACDDDTDCCAGLVCRPTLNRGTYQLEDRCLEPGSYQTPARDDRLCTRFGGDCDEHSECVSGQIGWLTGSCESPTLGDSCSCDAGGGCPENEQCDTGLSCRDGSCRINCTLNVTEHCPQAYTCVDQGFMDGLGAWCE
jgi:hypothetical protein